jgi:transcriptional regulator with XRE-family HTH domain
MTDDSPLLIQKLRLQRGWSQEQLAELTGLSVRTIQRIERGQTPSAESLKAIAAVLDVNFGALREAHMTSTANPPSNLGATPPPDSATNPAVSTDEALALARVRKIKAFYIQVVESVLILAFLAFVNLLTSPRYWWVLWAAIPWALALGLQGLRVFDKIPFLNADWEKRAVERYLGRKL